MSDGAIRRLRLGSGLVLFAYILSHLINHSLGIISLDHAEAGLRLAVKVWHSLPGTVLLYGAAAVHFLLALRTLALRRHWRLPLIEVVRLASGLTLPLLLIGHVMATRMAQALFDTPVSYGRTVANLAASGAEGWQLALLAPVGCMAASACGSRCGGRPGQRASATGWRRVSWPCRRSQASASTAWWRKPPR